MIDNRENIIQATQRLLQSHGLARLTTRDIAREANVAEGLIYHHFKDKAELIYKVVELRVSEATNLLQKLPLQVGMRTLKENLEDVLNIIYRVHYEIVPIAFTVFADRQLRVRLQEIMKETEMGPQRTIRSLAVYLAAEQRLGRLSSDVNPQVAAKCLWMISIQLAMDDQFTGRKTDAVALRREIRDHLQTLMTGLEPNSKMKAKKEQKK